MARVRRARTQVGKAVGQLATIGLLTLLAIWFTAPAVGAVPPHAAAAQAHQAGAGNAAPAAPAEAPAEVGPQRASGGPGQAHQGAAEPGPAAHAAGDRGPGEGQQGGRGGSVLDERDLDPERDHDPAPPVGQAAQPVGQAVRPVAQAAQPVIDAAGQAVNGQGGADDGGDAPAEQPAAPDPVPPPPEEPVPAVGGVPGDDLPEDPDVVGLLPPVVQDVVADVLPPPAPPAAEPQDSTADNDAPAAAVAEPFGAEEVTAGSARPDTGPAADVTAQAAPPPAAESAPSSPSSSSSGSSAAGDPERLAPAQDFLGVGDRVLTTAAGAARTAAEKPLLLGVGHTLVRVYPAANVALLLTILIALGMVRLGADERHLSSDVHTTDEVVKFT